jgi:hypothetical protein
MLKEQSQLGAMENAKRLEFRERNEILAHRLKKIVEINNERYMDFTERSILLLVRIKSRVL